MSLTQRPTTAVAVLLLASVFLASLETATARRGFSGSRPSLGGSKGSSSSTAKKVAAAAAAAAAAKHAAKHKHKTNNKKTSKMKKKIDVGDDEDPLSTAEGDDDAACFPAHARVTLGDGSLRRIDSLGLGDTIQAGPGIQSRVFAFTHRDASALHVFTRATTASGGVLEASHGHYVYIDGEPRPISELRVGHELTRESGEKDMVVQVAKEYGRGLYNPQTLHGDIVVNGFVTTTYTTAVEPTLAHVALAPLRAFYDWFETGFTPPQKEFSTCARS